MNKKEINYKVIVSIYNNKKYEYIEYIGTLESLSKDLKKYLGGIVPKTHSALIKALKNYTKKNETENKGIYFQVWEINF